METQIVRDLLIHFIGLVVGVYMSYDGIMALRDPERVFPRARRWFILPGGVMVLIATIISFVRDVVPKLH